jgi:hypothetical protein
MIKRTAFLVFLVMLSAGAALAAAPGARYETHMVFDEKTQRMVLFGGLTALDSGTAKAYDLGDTWEWNGLKWVERFTPSAPPARSSYMMVYDTNRQHTVMFGGKNGTTYLNDTWIYEGGAWSQVNTPNAPPTRVLAGAAYDPIRDRFVIYGGTGLDASLTAFPYLDTWEFDGTTWTQVASNGPNVAKPALVYDKARNKVYMVAEDSAVATHMYSYDPVAKSWTELKPTLLPACVNEGMLAYDPDRSKAVYTGGTCTNSLSSDATYEWDGTNWTQVTLNSDDGRSFGAAMAYDEARKVMTLYGGFYTTARYQTYVYSGGGWLSTGTDQPVQRSLAVFATDPADGVIWLYGGVSTGNGLTDLWSYQDGHFTLVSSDSAPVACSSPMGAWDTDRSKMVVFCGVLGFTYEYTPATNVWTTLVPKHTPATRSFASLVYDQHLKKSVLFGGWNGSNFLDDTWIWDGSDWAQITKNPPPSRELESMWYDPILQKTVIFGGLGRLTSQDRLTRYDDQWQFDGTGWVEIKPTTLPGTRYGASAAVDPRNGHTVLFGGLQLTGPDILQVQVYASDTWDWDGTNWTQITPSGTPDARENAPFAFDPQLKQFVMFAGYGGYYLSDLWTLTSPGTTATAGWSWRPWADSTVRRRPAGR